MLHCCEREVTLYGPGMFWQGAHAVTVLLARLVFAGARCFIVFHHIDFLQHLPPKSWLCKHSPLRLEWRFRYLLPGCFCGFDSPQKAPFIMSFIVYRLVN